MEQTELTKRTKQEKPYTQVCVWASTTVGEDNIELFEKTLLTQYNVRVKYLEEISTFPDRDDGGNNVEGTGGRSDVFFSIHEDDISSFAIKRLSFDPPVRWIEDMLASNKTIYPETVSNYTTWTTE
jgi:hypothetical protein|tara:strand:- start:1099 stop:1476 length:378 start_codon:yes stop_codon:yes gene_type:complete